VRRPLLSVADDKGQELKLDQLDFSGPSTAVSNDDETGSKTNAYLTEAMQQSYHSVVAGTP